MSETKAATKDPVCGMTVDAATAIHVDRDGKRSYFCSERCRRQFLSQPAMAKAASESSGDGT